MIENAAESRPHVLYGLIISCILIGLNIDLFDYKPLEVFATYNIQIFATMGYLLIDGKWLKKGSVKLKVKRSCSSEITADSAPDLLKEVGEIKERLSALEDGMQHMQEKMDKILQLSKDTGTDVGKLQISMDSIQQQGIKTVNKLINRVVDSLNHGAGSSQIDLAVTIQTSYSNLAPNDERSYNEFSKRVNTLKYFLATH